MRARGWCSLPTWTRRAGLAVRSRLGTGDEIDVGFWAAEGTLDVIVSDGGPGFTPARRASDDPTPGGMGLELVDALAQRWGSSADAPGAVWFRIAMRDDPPDVTPEAVQRAERLLDLRVLMDSLTEHGVLALDPTGHVTAWSPGAESVTGYSAADFLGRSLSDLYAPASSRSLERQLDQAVSGVDSEESWIRRKDGELVWAHAAVSPIRNDFGEVRGFSGVISDYTKHKELNDERDRLIAELRELALTDELTMLPNRRRWAHELERELARATRSGRPLTVAMLDLNRFKAFNDTHGHVAGDELAVTLPDCPPAEAFGVIERMQAATPPGVGTAAGLATTDGSESPEAVVIRADAALYEAKRRGKNAVLATTD